MIQLRSLLLNLAKEAITSNLLWLIGSNNIRKKTLLARALMYSGRLLAEGAIRYLAKTGKGEKLRAGTMFAGESLF